MFSWHMFNNFTALLIALGLLMLGVVLGDYLVRGPHRLPIDPIWQVPDADVHAGRAAIVAHGCGACHTIPGVRDANGRVGPRLDRIREQTFIAGHLPNTPDNLARWIQHPRDVAPGTAMPNLGVTEAEARNIVGYLYRVGGRPDGGQPAAADTRE